MALNFQRGAAAIEAAAKSGGKGDFKPFAPQIQWKDGDEKYVIFLNPLDEIPTVSLHEWIDCGQKKIGNNTYTDWGFFIDRTDPAIGEDSDPLTDKGSSPKKRTLAVAVELEPVLKDNGRGRKRPAGFTVKTMEYDRKTDDGTETVTAPVIGVVTQAQGNFFNLLVSIDESEGSLNETPVKIKRVGSDGKTAYQMTPYVDQEVDFTNLIENLEGISYLSRDEETWAEVENALGEADADVPHVIGVAVLEKRLNELADWDTYQEKTADIEVVESRYGNNDNKGGSNSRPARPARTSQRSASSDEAPAPARKARFDDLRKVAAASAAE